MLHAQLQYMEGIWNPLGRKEAANQTRKPYFIKGE